MSTIINGTSSAITFPDATVQNTAGLTSSSTLNASNVTTGTLPAARLPAGSVLQVITATFNNYASTSSTAFVTTGFSASITPSSATNKILVLMSANGSVSASNVQMTATIYRGGTDIITGGNGQGLVYSSAGASLTNPYSLQWLDSQATTSSTTYTIYFRNALNAAGAVNFNVTASSGQGTASIILMEITA